MKTNHFLILSAGISLLTASCKEDPKPVTGDKNQLSTSLVNNPATANGFPETTELADATMDFGGDTTFNFGSISDGEVVSHDFAFRNTGTQPLIITDAHASCGCTIPEYPKDPIPPGGSSKLKVSFNSKGKPGHNEKTISVTTNSNRGRNNLYISADVKSK